MLRVTDVLASDQGTIALLASYSFIAAALVQFGCPSRAVLICIFKHLQSTLLCSALIVELGSWAELPLSYRKQGQHFLIASNNPPAVSQQGAWIHDSLILIVPRRHGSPSSDHCSAVKTRNDKEVGTNSSYLAGVQACSQREGKHFIWK